MILAAAAFAASPHLAGDLLAGGAGGALVGGGTLVGVGIGEGSADLFDAGVYTLMAAPPLLGVSFFVEQGALGARAPSPAAGIVCLGAWAGAGVVLLLGNLDPYDDETTTTLALVGLWGTAMGAGVVGKVQQWDRRPPPKFSLGLSPSLGPHGGGLTIRGNF